MLRSRQYIHWGLGIRTGVGVSVSEQSRGLGIQTISLFVRIPRPWDQNIGKNSKMSFLCFQASYRGSEKVHELSIFIPLKKLINFMFLQIFTPVRIPRPPRQKNCGNIKLINWFWLSAYGEFLNLCRTSVACLEAEKSQFTVFSNFSIFWGVSVTERGSRYPNNSDTEIPVYSSIINN